MTNEIIRSNRLELLKNEVFGALDVTDATRNEYRVRITHFIRYAETHGINRNSYLDYKRYLARHIQRIDQKQIPDCGENLFGRIASVEFDSAENYGSCPRIHAVPTAPQRGLAGCRHRKVTTVLFRLTACPAKFEIESACRSLFVSRASADRGRPVGCRGH